jgi:hypothetical protein
MDAYNKLLHEMEAENKKSGTKVKRKMRRSKNFNTVVYFLCGRFHTQGFLPKERNHIESLSDFLGITVNGTKQILNDLEKLGLIVQKRTGNQADIGYFPVMNNDHMVISDYLEDAMINSRVDEKTKNQILDMYGVKKKETSS